MGRGTPGQRVLPRDERVAALRLAPFLRGRGKIKEVLRDTLRLLPKGLCPSGLPLRTLPSMLREQVAALRTIPLAPFLSGRGKIKEG